MAVLELVGETLQGEPLDVGSLRGDVVVLNFWADWCGPCRAEAPFLNAVAERTKDEGVRFVGVNVKDDRNAALAFERVREVSYPSIYDQPGVLLTRFRKVVPQTPPSTLLLDRRGRVAESGCDAPFRGRARACDAPRRRFGHPRRHAAGFRQPGRQQRHV